MRLDVGDVLLEAGESDLLLKPLEEGIVKLLLLLKLAELLAKRTDVHRKELQRRHRGGRVSLRRDPVLGKDAGEVVLC